jgi:tetratricopeptide (TPR) repeat protein
MAFGNRGFAYTNLGDHQKAINDYDQAIALNITKSSGIFWVKGNSLIVIIDSFLVLA